MSSELAAAIEDDSNILFSQSSAQKKPNADITTVQRMVSACLGSLLTSLVVTPFDVVRIRIQQQEVMPDTYKCCEQTNARLKSLPNSPKFDKPGIFWINQHYCDSAALCPRITSTFQGMSSIARNEGAATLWRGLSLTLFMAIPSNIIYFTGYEYIRDHSPIEHNVLNPLICGLLARTLAATLVAPVELIKTRLQSIPSEVRGADSRSKILSSLLRSSWNSIADRGIGSAFTGLKLTLWRDVPFLGIYWSCYELLKERIGKELGADFLAAPALQSQWPIFGTSFLSGSFAGVVAAFFTNPFDVGKTRLQIAIEEPEKRARGLMFRSLWKIYTNEGIQALYGGFMPRVMKIAPLCAIMISSYEIGKKIFKDNL